MLKPAKAQLFRDKITYLGFEVSEEGVAPIAQRVKAIASIPPPNSLTKLRSFIQMCSFYRRFIVNMSVPLTDLTKKDRLPFKTWSPYSEEQKAFEELKGLLIRAPVLRHPDPTLPYVISVDACRDGYGATLCQDFALPEGQKTKTGRTTERHPAYYASRKTRGGEKNYHASQNEANGVLWAFDKFSTLRPGSTNTRFNGSWSAEMAV